MLGLIELFIFFIFLMLVFWGINMYRHIKSGSWSFFQKIVDITGLILFTVIIFILIKPIM